MHSNPATQDWDDRVQIDKGVVCRPGSTGRRDGAREVVFYRIIPPAEQRSHLDKTARSYSLTSDTSIVSC